MSDRWLHCLVTCFQKFTDITAENYNSTKIEISFMRLIERKSKKMSLRAAQKWREIIKLTDFIDLNKN